MADAVRRPLTISVSDESGRPMTVRGLAAWLAGIAPATARGTVNIALVTDARIRELNRTYRRKDDVTDVLSFGGSTGSKSSKGAGAYPSNLSNPFLGDIVIARGVAKRQARDAGHSEATELRVLALHGLLHLLGYDHERDAGRMSRVERRLRRKGGLREGLIERAEPRATP